MRKSFLILLTPTGFVGSTQATDLSTLEQTDPGGYGLVYRYWNSWSHVEGHANRGATPAEVKEAEAELAWINKNKAHLQKFLNWLKAVEQNN